MGHHEGGGVQFFLRLKECSDDRLAGAAVQIAGRLVGKDQERVIHQSARHRGPLLLSSGDLRWIFARNLRDAEHFQELLCL